MGYITCTLTCFLGSTVTCAPSPCPTGLEVDTGPPRRISLDPTTCKPAYGKRYYWRTHQDAWLTIVEHVEYQKRNTPGPAPEGE